MALPVARAASYGGAHYLEISGMSKRLVWVGSRPSETIEMRPVQVEADRLLPVRSGPTNWRILNLAAGFYVEYSRQMDNSSAVRSFGALAQESRLAAFRLLIQAGEPGLPAGEIARTLCIPHNTLSTHLAILSQAGIVRSRREGRSIIYGVDFEGTRSLLAFLLEDCCRGKPELCSPAIESILAQCCG